MKALTIKEPWASAIVHGTKNIENRTWLRESMIGEVIAIHASKTSADERSYEICQDIASCFPEGPHDPDLEAPGCIIGTARIVSILSEGEEEGRIDPALWPWFEGPYGYELAEVEALAKPIPCKGALGFWEVDANVLAEMQGTPVAVAGERTRVVCKTDESYTVRITRGTYKHPNKWGNPHRLASRSHLHRIECLLAHARHLESSGLIDEVHELRGEVLGCVCSPERCHGDTLARCADAEDPRAELQHIIDELEAELATFTAGIATQESLFG